MNAPDASTTPNCAAAAPAAIFFKFSSPAAPGTILTCTPASRKYPFASATQANASRPNAPSPVKYVTRSSGMVSFGAERCPLHAPVTAAAAPNTAADRSPRLVWETEAVALQPGPAGALRGARGKGPPDSARSAPAG